MTSTHPTARAMRRQPRQMLMVFALAGFAGITGYLTITWLPNFLQTTLHAAPRDALLGAALGAMAMALVSPLAGRPSDRIGRRPVMAIAAAGIALVAYPLFELGMAPSFTRIGLATIALMALDGCFLGGSLATIAELFPTETRYSGVCVGYNLAQAVFSGTTPLLATALIRLTGWHTAPVIYLMAAALVMLFVLSRLPETRGVSLTGAELSPVPAPA